jgi:tripartite-type tricarboxylate transporter receptor subunit TctC
MVPAVAEVRAMRFHRRQFLQLAAGAAVVPAFARTAGAQSYPTRPVRIIVPFAAGGQTDAVARLVAQKLSDRLGKQFYVEDAPGGGGMIGAGRVVQAGADGYTLLSMDGTTYVVNPILFSKAPYDPYKDFGPVALPATTTQVLTVHPSMPVQTVRELVALIKANPGKYTYASSGVGSPSHLTSELFRTSLGLDLVHVPFNGAGPAVTSTMGGHTPIAFSSPAGCVAQVRQGNLRALAVATTKRLSALPDVSTMAEAGFPQVECDARIGFFAPSGTPKDIVDRLNREIAAIIVLPDVKERFAALGFEPLPNTPGEAAVLVKQEGEKWAKVIADAHIKVE